jgi:hypothetical protein
MSGDLLGEEFVSLTPVHFFSLSLSFPRLPKEHKGSIAQWASLPDLAGLSAEESVARVSAAWGDQGLLFELQVDGSFDHPSYPELEEGDCLELFIDTRNLKSVGFNHRFCHHFYFLPVAVDGAPRAAEVTRFRTEDSHEHCDPTELRVVDLKKSHWQLWIPKKCLVGYDPQQFDQIGFTYRLNRWAKKSRQHFAVHSREYAIDQLPGLWSNVGLVS